MRAFVREDFALFIEGVGFCDIKRLKVDLDGTLGLDEEGTTVTGHYFAVVQAGTDTPPHLPSLSFYIPALVPCCGWSPETRLVLIYSPSLYCPLPDCFCNGEIFLLPFSLFGSSIRYKARKQNENRRPNIRTSTTLIHCLTVCSFTAAFLFPTMSSSRRICMQ